MTGRDRIADDRAQRAAFDKARLGDATHPAFTYYDNPDGEPVRRARARVEELRRQGHHVVTKIDEAAELLLEALAHPDPDADDAQPKPKPKRRK